MLDTIVAEWFTTDNLDITDVRRLYKCWFFMHDWPDGAERTRRVLGLRADRLNACSQALVQMQCLDRTKAAEALLAPGAIPIDMDLVRAVRRATDGATLVDWIIKTDRDCCVRPGCGGTLAHARKTPGGKKAKTATPTVRPTRNETLLLTLMASPSNIGGTDPLAVRVFPKWCGVCGMEHRYDRAVAKHAAAPTGGRRTQDEMYFYDDVLGLHFLETSDRVLVARDLLLDITRTVIDLKSPSHGLASKLTNVARQHDPASTSSGVQIENWFVHKQLIEAFFLSNTLKMLHFYKGVAFSTTDFGAAFATKETFAKFLIDATLPDGLLAKALRRQGLQHQCSHPAHGMALVNDGCENAKRAICLTLKCTATPRQGTDWCSSCAAVPMPTGGEVLGKTCAVKLKVSHSHQPNRWMRFPATVASWRLDPTCQCTSDARCSHKRWKLALQASTELATNWSSQSGSASLERTPVRRVVCCTFLPEVATGRRHWPPCLLLHCRLPLPHGRCERADNRERAGTNG